MTEKRFKSNCKLGLVNGEEPLCKCLLDNGKHKSYREWVDLLNNLIDENEQLRKDNGRLRLKIESLNENFNRLNKLFNEVEDVDEDLMMEYIRIVGRTIDD